MFEIKKKGQRKASHCVLKPSQIQCFIACFSFLPKNEKWTNISIKRIQNPIISENLMFSRVFLF